MIAKVLGPHQDIGGSLRYVLGKEGAEVVPGGTLQGTTYGTLRQQTQVLEDASSTRSKSVVFHGILSLHPEEQLSTKQWSAVAQRYMDELGYGRSPYVVVKHNDTDHSHVHIVGLRVDDLGKRVSDSHEHLRSRAIADRIERDYGLRPGNPDGPGPKARVTTPSNEVQEARRTGQRLEDLPRSQVWQAMATSLTTLSTSSERSLPALFRALDREGVRVVPNVSDTTEKVSGLRFVHTSSGRSFTARELGADAQLPALAKLGFGVRPEDLPLLRAEKAFDQVQGGRAEASEASRVWATYLATGERPKASVPEVGLRVRQAADAVVAAGPTTLPTFV